VDKTQSVGKPFEIPKRLIWRAYLKVKDNKGSAGVDGQSLTEFEQDLKGNLYKLWNRMSSGSYFPAPVKAVPIPKSGGGTRVLGVPGVADRIAQTAATMVLEPLVEPLFHPDSYGYRPRRSALDAVERCKQRCWRRSWVVDLDIQGFFDNVPHAEIMAAVKKHTDVPVGGVVCESVATGPDATPGRTPCVPGERDSARLGDLPAVVESLSALRVGCLARPGVSNGAVRAVLRRCDSALLDSTAGGVRPPGRRGAVGRVRAALSSGEDVHRLLQAGRS
jgi:hypothetical protein